MSGQYAEEAITATYGGTSTFCKFLSANDTGETGSHQVGILISVRAGSMFFSREEIQNNDILKKNIRIIWQDSLITDSCATWYLSKGEFRITRFGRNFPFLNSENTGSLFVLVKQSYDVFFAYVLDNEEDIQQYLDAFGITPAQTNQLVELETITQEDEKQVIIDDFIKNLSGDFPSSETMSREARLISRYSSQGIIDSRIDPDRCLVAWTDSEYYLFRALEEVKYGTVISRGFSSVEEFVKIANEVLNRRKSRAGKSLEHHLCAIFDENRITYTTQGVTEGNKKPDFIFPSIEDYHDYSFPQKRLCSLAAKTTCKDRWRQVLNEADRLRDDYKYLCTLQRGVSPRQMDEMHAEKVILVVPKSYISDYPASRRDRIWTIKHFVKYVKAMEENL